MKIKYDKSTFNAYQTDFHRFSLGGDIRAHLSSLFNEAGGDRRKRGVRDAATAMAEVESALQAFSTALYRSGYEHGDPGIVLTTLLKD